MANLYATPSSAMTGGLIRNPEEVEAKTGVTITNPATEAQFSQEANQSLLPPDM